MKEGDGEANYAYYALHELHILPHDFVKLPKREKAALIAMIQFRIENEKKTRKKPKGRASG